MAFTALDMFLANHLPSWLNEGWTTYLERRIQAAAHGEPHRDFSAIIGWKALGNQCHIPHLEAKSLTQMQRIP
jgi:aminopeptidase N